MSWVPSPSPRLAASYREVQGPNGIPTVLGALPARRGPSMSPTGASCVPSALSFGMTTTAPPSIMAMTGSPLPYQAPRLQQRQGSFTPAPSVAQMHPSVAHLNTPYRGNMNNIPYAAPADAAFQNRSWTPLPVSGGLQRPMPNALDDRLSHSLTVLPFDFHGANLLGSPVPSPMGNQRPTNGFLPMGGGPPGFPNGGDSQLMTNGMVAMNGPPSPQDAQFSNHQRSSSFNQAPMPVIANIYWQRPVAFDQQGRVQRSLGGNELSWRQKFLKDVLGVYHVGIEVHGQEYSFGNYRAPGARMVGGGTSGVYCHEPRRPGPQCVFKHAETLGTTTVAPGQVEDICARYGSVDWSKASYNKIHHNCVDFARTLATELGAGEIPTWCYRGAAIAKVMGLGYDPLEDDSLEENHAAELSAIEQRPGAQPVPPPAPANMFPGPGLMNNPGINDRQAAMDFATRSRAGTYVAPPPLPGPLPGSRNGTYVAPPPINMALSGTYVGPPMGPMPMAGPPSPSKASFVAGSRVNVMQSNGSWLSGSIVMERPSDYEESTYTIMYDQHFNTEVNVAQHRLVPLPDGAAAPVMQSLNAVGLQAPPQPVFQGMASAESPKSFGNIAGAFPQPMMQSNHRVVGPGQIMVQRPQVPPAASFNMGGVRRNSAGPPPSAMSFGRPTATSVTPALRSVRPSTGSFQPSGYPMGARAPAQVPQMMMPRSTIGGGAMPRYR